MTYVIDTCLYAAIGRVFAFDDLDLSLATICEFFNELALCVKGVSNRPDEIRFVMFGFILWVQNVVGNRQWVVRVL